MKKPLLILVALLLTFIAKTQTNTLPTHKEETGVGLSIMNRQNLVTTFDFWYSRNNKLIAVGIGKSHPYGSEKLDAEFVQFHIDVGASVLKVAPMTHVVVNGRLGFNSVGDAFTTSSTGLSYIFTQLPRSSSRDGGRVEVSHKNHSRNERMRAAFTAFSIELRHDYDFMGNSYISPEFGFDSKYGNFFGGVRISRTIRFRFSILIGD